MVLREIYKYLKSRTTGHKNYAVPKLWVRGFESKLGDIFEEKEKVYFVDPYAYFSKVIGLILENSQDEINYSMSLSRIRGEFSPEWIKKAVFYGTLPRMTAAFNHKGFGNFEESDILGFKESGTFLKMIALLPYIKRLGVNTLYMLPISKPSNLFKKGSIGSPYAVKNPMMLDEGYHDSLLEEFTVEDEFKALVEAAHVLGIRIVLDFIPRTAARDSDIIREHPDWFYWIKVDDLPFYKPPRIEELPFKIPDKDDLSVIYNNKDVKTHLKRFVDSPDKIDPEKWERVKKMNGNILINIIKEFGIVTPPGFSDWINDSQPTWDDVTFLRLYLDHPRDVRKYISKNQKPYILFDVIKASKFPGEVPNRELWEYLSDIIPGYQKRFGIDGARIDMGHALPSDLQDMIISRAKDYDPAFSFIAEELEMKNDEKAMKEGYHAILGNSWYAVARREEFYKLLEDTSPKLKLPFLASCETPDTPRIKSRENGEKLKFLAPFLLYFSPNGIPYINSGQEIGELQPMNLGLDNTIWGKTVLPPDDEFYGKLAFFEHYVLHWGDYDEELYNYLTNLMALRKRYESFLYSGEFKYVYFSYQDGFLANMSYWLEDRGIIIVGNLDLAWKRDFEIYIDKTAQRPIHIKNLKLWTRYGEKEIEVSNDILLSLNPGEFLLLGINI
ncbi:maltodextrin glycosyltransferase [Thermosipho ferrireducens]|uniref:Maltodextrin glycosyltransferase n=1 Tax=Thermosipho ferrireducens TaxID=2571116 RepID=A0ABX7S9M6_9BACT|nr:alpha-amylase family glycosyl hydrolase [Thermosipho ferrireducens]QTA38663.1 maltodextrin glycosyltransferase [Thermosipho ferrireducens]